MVACLAAARCSCLRWMLDPTVSSATPNSLMWRVFSALGSGSPACTSHEIYSHGGRGIILTRASADCPPDPAARDYHLHHIRETVLGADAVTASLLNLTFSTWPFSAKAPRETDFNAACSEPPLYVNDDQARKKLCKRDRLDLRSLLRKSTCSPC